jgi:hypothetical protein
MLPRHHLLFNEVTNKKIMKDATVAALLSKFAFSPDPMTVLTFNDPHVPPP